MGGALQFAVQVPALVAFVIFGRTIVGALYQRVDFTADDTYVVRIRRTLGLRPPFDRLAGRLLPGALTAGIAGFLLMRAMAGAPHLLTAPVCLVALPVIAALLAVVGGVAYVRRRRRR